MRRRAALPDAALVPRKLGLNDAGDRALGQLLGELREARYRFVPPTPETHRRVIARLGEAQDARGVFGWSLDFRRETLPAGWFELMDHAGVLERRGALYRSAVRVASLGECLFLHSAFPTDQADSVFFGPDSYRFVRFLQRELAGSPAPDALVDIGAGSGVGGICAARMLPGARAALVDINPLALRFAAINARHNCVPADTAEGSGVEPVEGPIALAITNPPFIVDPAGRAYRDGGAMLGAGLSLDWALATAAKLAPGGRLLLYTGSAIVAGIDRLEAALREALPSDRYILRYEEIDPDIFGEQLDEPPYRTVERIAAVGAVIERR